MATTQAIDATIFASSHPDIAKRTSFSGVLISSVMLVVGVIAFASTFGLEDKSSTVSMALMVLGTGLFLMGGLDTHPDNMVDGQLIAEYDFFIFVYVDESRQPGKRQAKIVEIGRAHV